MTQATTFDPYAMPPAAIQEPPASLWGALRKIGPGIILAGSIVGSGELILTTSLGAKFGFLYLWLILLSCVIKVFVQIELGRYAISSGKPTLGALHDLPGPRLGTHWLVWWWFLMLLATVTQLGAMVGGVGQALNLAFPQVIESLARAASEISPPLADSLLAHREYPWAALTALTAITLLLSGGYRRIERVTTAMVVAVTAMTVACVCVLPSAGYSIHLSDLIDGLKFTIPAGGVAIAFGVFGITGVGASELYAYPYWCLEKGYARFTGPCSSDHQWVRRARGWLRVMYLDAWLSMIVFTVATIAFYFLGATVLHRQQLDPKGSAMIATLSEMYVPAFGDWTQLLFLIGAWAVLFKTFYVASASQSRLTADFLSLAGFLRYSALSDRTRIIRILCVFFPCLALTEYLFIREPRGMVAFGGFAQAITLPAISGAAVYLRFRRTDRRLAPSRLADLCLWFALLTTAAVAAYALWDRFAAKSASTASSPLSLPWRAINFTSATPALRHSSVVCRRVGAPRIVKGPSCPTSFRPSGTSSSSFAIGFSSWPSPSRSPRWPSSPRCG